jgi:polysaccharide biosynthesis protein PslG
LSWFSRLLDLLTGRDRPQPPSSPRPLDADRASLVARSRDGAFGVNAHNARPEMMRTLYQGGIRWFRLDVDWDLIEPVQGERDWAALDTSVAELRAQNAHLLGSVAYTPAWASGANPAAPRERRQGLMPRDPNLFLGFLETVIDRYGGAFAAMAVWNEPNQEKYFGGSRPDYLKRILRPGLELLRDRAPHILRCGPDLSSSPPKKPQEWMEGVLDEAGGLMDVITHHQYDGGERVDRRVRAIEELHALVTRKGFGDRDLWVTETGWKRGEVSDREQADALAGIMRAMVTRPWWTKTFWFDSHGSGEGLLGTDNAPDAGQPYPVFDRYVQVIAEVERGGSTQRA